MDQNESNFNTPSENHIFGRVYWIFFLHFLQVIIDAEQEMEEIIKTTENHESVEESVVQMGDNMVLRKLLVS